jgi:hypothetical protein
MNANLNISDTTLQHAQIRFFVNGLYTEKFISYNRFHNPPTKTSTGTFSDNKPPPENNGTTYYTKPEQGTGKLVGLY